MSLVGSDFVEQCRDTDCRCSECGEKISSGTKFLASIRWGKTQKIVCGEDCRQEFDNRFWQERARERKLDIAKRGHLLAGGVK